MTMLFKDHLEAGVQHCFNVVATHLLTQNERSNEEDKAGRLTCVYRSQQGLKCAVGCLIHEDEYTTEIELAGVSSPRFRNYIKGIDKDKLDTIDMLKELQYMHDNTPVALWKGQLTCLAHNLSLSMPTLPTQKGTQT